MDKPFKKYNAKEKAHGWAIDIEIHCKRYRRWFRTRGLAEDFIKRKKDERDARRNGSPLPINKPAAAVTLFDLWNRFSSDSLYQSKEQGYRQQLARSWVRFLKITGNISVRDVTSTHLRELAARLLKEFPSTNTHKHYYTAVIVVLNTTADLFPKTHADYAAPKVNLKRVGFRAKFARRNRLITPHELITIYRGLLAPTDSKKENQENRRAHVSDFWALLFLIPKRESEWITLEWRDVNFEAEEITFTINKTGDLQTLPMTAAVIEILQRRKQRYPRPFPIDWFVAGSTDRIRHHRFGHPIQRVCQQHGIPYGDRTSGGLVPHDMRHTSATTMAQGLIDTPTIGTVLAHELGDGATPIYLHSTALQVKKALELLAQRWQEYCRDFDG